MQYPLISEYLRAISSAEDNLDQLKHLRPVMDNYGEPQRSGGAFAVVFKMEDPATGRRYALKCFTEEQPGRGEAYARIVAELGLVDSPYITPVQYLERELFVDSDCEEEEFPVLLMDWVEGETLDAYIRAHVGDTGAMRTLCGRFCRMAMWLRSQPFAHGDLKPDNVIVRGDGTLALVDYDGMYVPSMRGMHSPTLGTRDFSHPQRTAADFDESIDDFALTVMALSLKALSVDASLYGRFATADGMLLSEKDFRCLHESAALNAIRKHLADRELACLYGMFVLAHANKNLNQCSFRLFAMGGDTAPSVVRPTGSTIDLNKRPRPEAKKVPPSPFRKYTVNGVTFEMVWVDGGMFTMGATAEQGDDAFDDEKPAHEVTLDGYSIGRTPVTQALWVAVMGNNPSWFKGKNRPVENVSWEDCREFIKGLNAKTGGSFRLPTEAEWEYAARGGSKSKGYKYSGSDNIGEVAWYDGSVFSGSTHDVATKKDNELGIYDMSGNVWEWCGDWYGDYGNTVQTNPKGPSSGSSRVYRGGCWFIAARDCRGANRGYSTPYFRNNNLGLRLVTVP